MARMPSFRPPKKIQQRQLELRARLWPGLNSGDLWNRLTHDGFSTVPSTMPLIMSIIDDLSNGRPASMPVARQSGWEHSDNQDGHFGGRGESMIVAARR